MVQYEIDNRQSDDGAVSQRVVAAVAEAHSTDPTELPPLYDAVDPDALDALFDRGNYGERENPGRVVFMFADCEVVVHSDGEVTVTAPSDQSPTSSAVDPVDEQDETESAHE